jgi:hypothetical protein
MTLRCFTLALLIIVVLPNSGCARQNDCGFKANPAVHAPLIPDSLGVNIYFTDARPGELKMLSEAGFRWVRMDLKWDLTETARGEYDFAPYDRLMTALAENHLQALFILDYTNPLYDNGAPPRTENSRRAFTSWAVAAAKHFAGRKVIWETYNEPNIAQFWPPQPNAKDYVALALAVARAFREAVPDEQLIGPATAGIDFPFLEACFKAGLLDYWSAVSVHPYRRSDPETAASDYCRLRAMIQSYSPKKTIPIISGEWGYSSAWPRMSEDKQGRMLARQWLTNVANEISLSIWYDWQDDGADPNEPEHHFGVVANSYYENRASQFPPKPAYLAAKTLTTFFNGYQFEKRIAVGNPDDYVLVFRNQNNNVRFAAWTTNRPHNVLVPLGPGDYEALGHTGGGAAMVNADAKGLSLTLSTAPVYVR